MAKSQKEKNLTCEAFGVSMLQLSEILSKIVSELVSIKQCSYSSAVTKGLPKGPLPNSLPATDKVSVDNKEAGETRQRAKSNAGKKRNRFSQPQDTVNFMHSMHDTIAKSSSHFGLLINDTGEKTFAGKRKKVAELLGLDTNEFEIEGQNVV